MQILPYKFQHAYYTRGLLYILEIENQYGHVSYTQSYIERI